MNNSTGAKYEQMDITMSLQLLLELNELRCDTITTRETVETLKNLLCLNANKKLNYRSWSNVQEDIAFVKEKAMC